MLIITAEQWPFKWSLVSKVISDAQEITVLTENGETCNDS
jgi:hypothetical protein